MLGLIVLKISLKLFCNLINQNYLYQTSNNTVKDYLVLNDIKFRSINSEGIESEFVLIDKLWICFIEQGRAR